MRLEYEQKRIGDGCLSILAYLILGLSAILSVGLGLAVFGTPFVRWMNGDWPERQTRL